LCIRYTAFIDCGKLKKTRLTWLPKAKSIPNFFNINHSFQMLKGDTHTNRQHGSLISLLPFVKEKVGLIKSIGEKKTIPLEVWSGPECSRKLRFPDFMTTAQDGAKICQPYASAAFTSRKYTWHLFLLEAEATPGP